MEVLSKTLRTSLFLALLLLGTSAMAQDEDQKLVRFKIKNAGVNVSGSFDSSRVVGMFDESNLANSRFEVTIPVRTIDTGIGARDKHLKKEKYFHIDKYPQITFKSTGFAKTAVGYQITGMLTMKATTKEVTINFLVYDLGNGEKSLRGRFNLDRRDYGVGKGHLILGDQVKISIDYPYKSNGS